MRVVLSLDDSNVTDVKDFDRHEHFFMIPDELIKNFPTTSTTY